MNREIKFRAWDTELKSFYKDMDGVGGYYYDNGVDDCDGRYVLMQYTGLKDRTGRDVYEGDVLFHKTDGVEYDGSKSDVLTHKAYVYYSGYMFNIKEIESTRPVNIYPMTLLEFFEKSEVIGNIYENPEFLK